MATVTPLCADTARERGDVMQGTALNVQRFLLVEHPGPWAFDALGESGIDPAVLGQLLAATQQAGARTLLIRRHGRVENSGERRWAVADITGGSILWGAWSDDADLLAAREALAEPSTGWSTNRSCSSARTDATTRAARSAVARSRRHCRASWRPGVGVQSRRRRPVRTDRRRAARRHLLRRAGRRRMPATSSTAISPAP